MSAADGLLWGDAPDEDFCPNCGLYWSCVGDVDLHTIYHERVDRAIQNAAFGLPFASQLVRNRGSNVVSV